MKWAVFLSLFIKTLKLTVMYPLYHTNFFRQHPHNQDYCIPLPFYPI